MSDQPASQSSPTQPVGTPTINQDHENRLQIVEKSHQTTFDILKWAFGLLITFTLTLIGSNLWTSHSEYAKDKDYLTQQVQLLENRLEMDKQELKISEDKKLADMQAEIHQSFMATSNSLQAQCTAIIQTNASSWLNIASAVSNEYISMTTNLLALDNAIKAENFRFTTNNFEALANELNEQFHTIETNFNKQSDRAIGMSLLVEANYMPKKSLSDKQYTFHDYLLSAVYFLRAGDEDNAHRAIQNILQKDVFQLYLLSMSKDTYKSRETEYPLSEALNLLVTQLNNLNGNGRYEDELKILKFCQGVISERLGK